MKNLYLNAEKLLFDLAVNSNGLLHLGSLVENFLVDRETIFWNNKLN